jgi:hypothetical protein
MSGLSPAAALVYIQDAVEDAGHELGASWRDGDAVLVEVTIHGEKFLLCLERTED